MKAAQSNKTQALPEGKTKPMGKNWSGVTQALVGVVIGSFLSFSGSYYIFKKTNDDLESMEIRRQKVDCLSNLAGLRFVTAKEQSAPDEYRSRFMFEMNRIPTLWHDDGAVLADTRDFYAARTNERLIKLIRDMGKTTKLALDGLSDNDMEHVVLMQLSGH